MDSLDKPIEPPSKVLKTEEKEIAHQLIECIKKPEHEERKSIKRKKEYRKLRFKGAVYEIGNTIIVKQEDDTNLIGSLKKIIAKGGKEENPDWPCVDLICYCKKDKINKEKNHIDKDIYENLGDNELFETNQEIRIFVDTITSICQVIQ